MWVVKYIGIVSFVLYNMIYVIYKAKMRPFIMVVLGNIVFWCWYKAYVIDHRVFLTTFPRFY